MKTITDHIRARLLRCLESKRTVSLDEMQSYQWSDEFERLMRNRLTVGGYRYGPIGRQGPQYDNVGSLIRRAQKYLVDGNQEHLVDIAALAMVEFVRGCCHPAPHFSPVDDGEHTEVVEAPEVCPIGWVNCQAEPYTTYEAKEHLLCDLCHERSRCHSADGVDSTCCMCFKKETCRSAFDEYNTDGDCLESK